MQAVSTRRKREHLLRRVGLWATIWWAFSGLYIVLVIWLAKSYYVQRINSAYHDSELSAWGWSVKQAYLDHSVLQWLMAIILIGWVTGYLVWLKALKRANISYRSGLKDLFLTIR